mgnify:CR=1 FL=1
MSKKSTVLPLLVLMAMATPALANPRGASPDDVRAVEQASARFYEALNALFTGDAAPMGEVWSHADDVTYMGPAGGFQVGWSEVRGIWRSQADLKRGGKVEPADVHVAVGQDLAVVQCTEVGQNFDAQGQPVQVSIRATNVFRNEGGEWKMIGHHTDLLPFLKK